jgi:ATP-dependent DNA helicase RecG
MHRLLQGDVGSGKTVVAVAAALRAIESGYQAVIMAPTELLAEQHWQTVQRVAGGLGVELWYLTGEATAADRRAVVPRLARGESGLAVGTHALIQEEVVFAKLGLAVIDEQHRFGVMQRAALSQASGGVSPDVLLMTATPIPRTLALSVYGDLDLSFLDELPPGRKPITTRLFAEHHRSRAYDLVRRELAAGRQAYNVYPQIEESEKTDLKDATNAARELSETVFPEFSVALIHGRMGSTERDTIMRDFKSGKHQVLVSTTVIEVGIDVANATVMVIEHPERFGLAQLHQLRGRVGRGAAESHCILMPGEGANHERLKRFAATQDGFRIAELDLAERGHGELVGARQAGQVALRFADLSRDADLLDVAHRLAREAIQADPSLSAPALQPVVTEIGRHFERGLELFRAIPG